MALVKSSQIVQFSQMSVFISELSALTNTDQQGELGYLGLFCSAVKLLVTERMLAPISLRMRHFSFSSS